MAGSRAGGAGDVASSLLRPAHRGGRLTWGGSIRNRNAPRFAFASVRDNDRRRGRVIVVAVAPPRVVPGSVRNRNSVGDVSIDRLAVAGIGINVGKESGAA